MADFLTFLVPVDHDDEDDSHMGVFGRGERETKLVQIPVSSLRQNLRDSVTVLKTVLEEAASSSGAMRLKEAHVQFEVSAAGGIRFVGTTELGARGSITLVFGQ
jgi:hypothetical protein